MSKQVTEKELIDNGFVLKGQDYVKKGTESYAFATYTGCGDCDYCEAEYNGGTCIYVTTEWNLCGDL